MAHKKNVELKKSFERMNYLYSGMNKTSDFRNKNLINFVIKYLRKGSVLDIGCGDGTFLNQISKMEYVSYGIEPNKQMFDIINKNKNKNVNIYNLFAEDIEKIDIIP